MDEIIRKMIWKLTDTCPENLGIVHSLMRFKDFNRIIWQLHRRGIKGKLLKEYWQEAGGTPLQFVNRLNKEIKGSMYRPIITKDLR